MIAIGARFDDRVTGRLDGFSPGSAEDPRRHRSRRRSTRTCRSTCRSSAMPSAGAGGAARPRWRGRGNTSSTRLGTRALVAADRRVAGQGQPPLPAAGTVDQAAIRDRAALPADQGARRPTSPPRSASTRCGRRSTSTSSEPLHWMTSGGLGTMGYGLPAAMGVQVAHPEALVIDIAGEASWVMNMQEMSTCHAVPAAGEVVHPQQQLHGHGPPVAGVLPRQPPLRELHGQPAGLREAGRGVRRGGAARDHSRARSTT